MDIPAAHGAQQHTGGLLRPVGSAVAAPRQQDRALLGLRNRLFLPEVPGAVVGLQSAAHVQEPAGQLREVDGGRDEDIAGISIRWSAPTIPTTVPPSGTRRLWQGYGASRRFSTGKSDPQRYFSAISRELSRNSSRAAARTVSIGRAASPSPSCCRAKPRTARSGAPSPPPASRTAPFLALAMGFSCRKCLADVVGGEDDLSRLADDGNDLFQHICSFLCEKMWTRTIFFVTLSLRKQQEDPL